ncbi:MAG: phosphatase PAP2 family protein [Thermodesulfobacteriota bacterium]|nr:phosphatase PAP2 family protein [Thermodesulfobacteriota bacterium]
MSVNFKKNKVLRKDETLALAFLAVATIVSSIYGYSLRFYILTDIIFHYLLVFPIFLVFLFYAYIKNPYLKFGWTILALGPTVCLIFVLACSDINGLCEKINLGLISFVGVLLWACSLIIYILKRTKRNNPYFSSIKIKTLSLNILMFIRDWIPIFIVLFSYCTLKSIIPVVNPVLFDEQFNTMDYNLFFKHSPTELIIEWIPVYFIGFLSFGYKFYFLIKIFAFSAIYCNVNDKRVFYKMIIAFSTTIILGLGLYFLFPAQGPIYHCPEQFEKIQTPMSETSNYKLQKDLWTVYEQVKKHTPQDFCELTKTSGIRNGVAAFPSLHIAISCVLLYFLFRYNRAIFWLCFFPFWVMVLSTIYFGWHYVVDDIAGFVLAGFVLASVNRLLNDINM